MKSKTEDILTKIKGNDEIFKSNVLLEDQIIDKTMQLEILEIKLSTKLLLIVQEDEELLNNIKSIRNIIAGELGFVIPQIRLQEDTKLESNEYIINLKRVPIAYGSIDGLKASNTISIHLYELIISHSTEILTIQDLLNIIDRLKCDFPFIVEEAMKVITFKVLLEICKKLLDEGIPIIDMITILEATTYFSQFTKSPEILLEYVRSKLFRMITNKYLCSDGNLHILKLKPALEEDILNRIQNQSGFSKLLLSKEEIDNLVGNTRKLLNEIDKKWENQVVIVVDSIIRKRLSEIYKKHNLKIAVLSDNELNTKVNLIIDGNLSW